MRKIQAASTVLGIAFSFTALADVPDGVEAYRAGDYAKALAEFSRFSDDPIAQRYLGFMYQRGQSVAKDYKTGIEWLRKAAAQGDSGAQTGLGASYYYGQGVARDYQQAAEWFRKSAEQGALSGAQWLASLYAEGRGVEKDANQAIRWATQAYEQGDDSSPELIGKIYLGIMYSFPNFPKDEKKAIEWYRRAAEKGNTYAATELSNTLLSRQYPVEPAPKSPDALKKWFDKLPSLIDKKRETAPPVRPQLASSSPSAPPRDPKKIEAQVKQIGSKICMSGSGTARKPAGVVVSGKPYYQAVSGEFQLTGFTEGLSGRRIQIRISGIKFLQAANYETLNLEEFDYAGSSIKAGSIIWDEVSNWNPC